MPATAPVKTKRLRRKAMSLPLPAETEWTAVRVDLEKCLTDEQLLRFSVDHHDLRIEQTGEGELIIMPPTFGETGNWELELGTDFTIWARGSGGGKVFGSNAGFRLPDNSVFAPDVSWGQSRAFGAVAAGWVEAFYPHLP